MDTYKPILSRREAGLIFALVAVVIHIWAYIQLFRQIPAWVLRLSLSELVGATSYVLMAALLESLFIAGLVLLVGLLPARRIPEWLKEPFTTALAALFLAGALWTGVLVIYRDDFRSVPAIAGWIAGLLATCAVFTFLVLRVEVITRLWKKLMERLTLLSNLYLAIDVVAVFIVIWRNLSI